jgi:Domain of unknown function (DUF4331)
VPKSFVITLRAARSPAGRRTSFHGFQWTGQDAFADKNVLSIVMEVPHDMLSADPMIGLWVSVSQRQRDGSLVQVDRGGHPTINPFVNPNNVKNTYNLGQPVRQDPPQGLNPHADLLTEFPYLGPPNVYPV